VKPGRFVAFLLLWPAAPVFAQTGPGPAPAPATVRVALHTGAGDIVVAVETERAPVSARNFLRYVDQRRLDGASFYRAMIVGPRDGLIQGGWRTNPRRMLPPIAHEPTSRTGLSHTDGAIALARGAPGTATSEFYIVAGDMTGLDASAADPGYAVFGRVVEGMDVVRRILAAPRSPTDGAGTGMAGQILSPAVRIITARRVR
jgi:peptidyl-prolyl cis-trans isomerase A (cyclophilin A)